VAGAVAWAPEGSWEGGAQVWLWRPLLGQTTLYPGVMIVLTVLSINFVGDGLRDALDARMTL